jgi:hypothetical protein
MRFSIEGPLERWNVKGRQERYQVWPRGNGVRPLCAKLPRIPVGRGRSCRRSSNHRPRGSSPVPLLIQLHRLAYNYY